MDDKKSEHKKGPAKGDFIAPPAIADTDEAKDALPSQEEFWRPPARFGSVPVEREPLGWDRRRGFRKLFPLAPLPFQVVERVAFGHPELEPNRLFWGDNLHVMRQLPSESIDLIYIDPPFFSGRNYNVIFGDQNELRSFSDIWEGGMPGYLIWLNARLYEMKRLLRKGGSIYVHLDWHSVHYVKVELDKIFGADAFRNEVVWYYYNKMHDRRKKLLPRSHDSILVYAKSGGTPKFSPVDIPLEQPVKRLARKKVGGRAVNARDEDGNIIYIMKNSRALDDVWRISMLQPADKTYRIGYPTEKPPTLLEYIIKTSSEEGDVVADFFGGGGVTPFVAHRLNRRWIACDQSRVAVAITAGRITRQVEEGTGRLYPVPDFTVEHWGVYETGRLAKTPPDQFRAFVLRAFGAVPEEGSTIHGMKGAVPVWVGNPDPKKSVTAEEVVAFANAVRGGLRYQQDNLRDGIMLAWAFKPDAVQAAERLKRLEATDLDFIRLEQIRIDSPRFREHVAALSTDHADYANFLTFVQPPKVEVAWKRLGSRHYRFDAGDSIVMNQGAKIINVQWDFDYGEHFSSSPGHAYKRGADAMTADYEFASSGRKTVAAKVQDDMGGEGLWTGKVEVN
ncbi:site-specific DNA-methyltransferase [Mesorhizobium sp. STM 4661]|uniref:DNA-methyltransferase n=1 Tax=Mesorhizobium sp. STM 4661 TaxID=1297570 RepID=UPI0002BED2B3|nr:site-specific DNA-methyltransferase [Mesorhizobium sp. STM 4661]CCV11361.1 putative Site-specific DNA-methyltransferase (adenine-specific) [Mesorhizobium sp. STM 4661]